MGCASASVGAAVATLAVAGVVTSAQVQTPRFRPSFPGIQCLHESTETAAERQRREQAHSTVQLIDKVVNLARSPLMGRPRSTTYPSWDDVAVVGARLGRMDGGPTGRLAREVRWGSTEPLPGWNAHYVADANGYSLSLTDLRDACGWTYFSDERGAVGEGYRLNDGKGIVPVDSR